MYEKLAVQLDRASVRFRSWSDRPWRRIRRWPGLGQFLLWLVAWPVLLLAWLWRSGVRAWVKLGTTLAAVALVVAAAVSPSSATVQPVTAPSARPSPSPSPEPTFSLQPVLLPPTPSLATVPVLVGSDFASARQVLLDQGFKVRRVLRVSDSDIPGTVIDQVPAFGTAAQPGSTVTLYVARVNATPSGVSCPSDPLRGVYHSYRLTVLKACQWFVGTVVAIKPEADGDHHIDIKPDKGYDKFLNSADIEQRHGGLLIEIMPGQEIPIPEIGEHVSVLGTWVYDTDHGWNEFHPIWAMKYLDSGKLVAALPPKTPQYNPDQTSSGGGSGGGSNCDPAYPDVCLQDGIGDWDCAGGTGNGPNFVQGPIRVLPPDPFGLDGNHDGWGCTS